ncbi:MAG: amidohydrolase family protein [Planctomycetes bacterium]|nr:amidohydrolase family protein [Planctomycetota bacterium]
MPEPLLLLQLITLLAGVVVDEPDTHSNVVAFRGARILPVTAPAIERGTLLVRDGKIAAIGPIDQVAIPEGATVHDVEGRVLMPGLVCSHSHIGEGSGADRSAPIQPECRIVDAIDVRSPSIQKAQAGGLTVVNVMPGSGHLLSGQTVYLKLRDGRTIDDLVIPDDRGLPRGGMKMANGTNSRRQPPFPGTRAKSAALMREALIAAQEYGNKLELAKAGRGEFPERDLGKEALLEVLSGRRMVHHHTHRHDDILTVLRLKEEFGFRVVLHHVSDGWKVAQEIAQAQVPCSVIVIDAPGGKIEAKDLSLETGRILDEAGVLVGFHTDDGITDSRVFLRSAALAVRAGMDPGKALYALTMANAIMLDLGDRIGSLDVGKDADLALLSGEPFSVYTHVLETWVDGVKVFDRSDPQDHLYAVGGLGAGHGGDTTCCEEVRER